MSLQQLKLNKQLTEACLDNGITSPKEIQEKSFSRIMGGQNLVLSGPEGTGKTTNLILSCLMQLKYQHEMAPRALFLVSNREAADELEQEIEKYNELLKLRILTVTPGRGMDGQRDDLFAGCDIVIGTPDRVQTLLLQSGININKIKMFVIEDAELMIKQGFQVQINRITEGLPKCQRIFTTQVIGPKLEKLIEEVLEYPQIIEVNNETTENPDYLSTDFYLVSNFSTKINLLKYIAPEFKKAVIIANTRLTAGKLYQKLSNQFPEMLAMKTPLFYDQYAIDSVDLFVESDFRMLFISHEDNFNIENLDGIDNIIFVDIDDNIDRVASYIKFDNSNDIKCTFFVTDIELGNLKQLEAYTSMTANELDFPEDVQIAGMTKKQQTEKDDPTQGGAFHEKKAKNTKTYNYNTRDRRLMKGKVSKRKNH